MSVEKVEGRNRADLYFRVVYAIALIVSTALIWFSFRTVGPNP